MRREVKLDSIKAWMALRYGVNMLWLNRDKRNEKKIAYYYTIFRGLVGHYRIGTQAELNTWLGHTRGYTKYREMNNLYGSAWIPYQNLDKFLDTGEGLIPTPLQENLHEPIEI